MLGSVRNMESSRKDNTRRRKQAKGFANEASKIEKLMGDVKEFIAENRFARSAFIPARHLQAKRRPVKSGHLQFPPPSHGARAILLREDTFHALARSPFVLLRQ